MLTLHEHNETNFNNLGIHVLHEAENVAIQRELNGDYTLEFEYPVISEKYPEITVNRLVQCEGQIFRINHISASNDGVLTSVFQALHIYRDCEMLHIPKIKNFMGYAPRTIVVEAFKDTDYHVMTEAEVNALGMKWIGGKIDFWEQSKTNPSEVVKTVIKNAGFGELYIDNKNIAIVERIGTDNGVRLDTTKNLSSITKDLDITELITRLYPYGQNDLHIGSVNNDVQYIDSPNIGKYGLKSKFRDYNDINTAASLKSRAVWEFDEENENRIDVPTLNVSCKMVDLYKLEEYGEAERINLGDTVHVYDDALGLMNLKERVIKLKWYPYEPIMSEVGIGRMQKDMWYFFKRLVVETDNYDKVSNNNGDIETNYLQGVLNSDVNHLISENERFQIVGDLLTVQDNAGNIRIKLGRENGRFVFKIYNDNEVQTIYIDDNGNAVFSGVVATGEDCVVGAELTVGARNELGRIWLSSMSSAHAACIENTSDGDTVIRSQSGADLIFGQDGGIYINAARNDNELIKRSITDDLERRILILEAKINGINNI